MNNQYDVIVIGSGPAGMSAALYCARANMRTLIVEKECPGGKIIKAKEIANYIGGSEDPFTLANSMFSQMSKNGVKYVRGNVIFIEENGLNKKIVLHDGKEFFAKAIIIATGGKLGGSQFKYDKYLNKGLSYCAVCDGNFYKEKSVAVIGNNDSVENTVDYLSNIATNIYFINIEDKESTSKNVENFTNITEYAIGGENRVEYVKIGDKTINVDGVFYDLESNSFSGFSSKLETQNGYIKVDTNQQTSIEGIFAAGDIVNGSVKQVIVASSQGAIAALSAIKYINKNKKDA